MISSSKSGNVEIFHDFRRQVAQIAFLSLPDWALKQNQQTVSPPF